MWMRYLADASSQSSSIVVGLISGIVAIIVAFFGYLGLRTRPGQNSQSQNGGNQGDQTWAVDLRKQRDDLQAQIKERDCEIERLELICMSHSINPKTGDKIVNLRRSNPS